MFRCHIVERTEPHTGSPAALSVSPYSVGRRGGMDLRGMPRATNLGVLGLGRIPASEAELRSAYRRAAKATRPDARGSEDAFRTVVEAFERLSGRPMLMA